MDSRQKLCHFLSENILNWKHLSAFYSRAYFSGAYQMLFCVLLLNTELESHGTKQQTLHATHILEFSLSESIS